MKRAKTQPDEVMVESQAYLADWLALSPAERLRRSWRMRRRIRDIGAVHDAKSFPQL